LFDEIDELAWRLAMKRTLLVMALALAAGVLCAAADKPATGWEFLSTTDIAAKAFVDAHPQWDGRGVLIAVCDSGVDLGTPGLLKTPDGKAKIIDARVFCDEGKIELEKAEAGSDANGEAWYGKDGKWLYGLDKQAVKPATGEEVLIGYFKESDFKNSDANSGDFNNNGSSDDVYGLVVFKGPEGKWVAFLDTNGDGNLADEKPTGDFTDTHEAFQLRGRDVHAQANLMTFALNLWPDEKKAALYMADGSHGTHVSGICAGYEIDGQAGYNGIAPGAQILALKIGNNTLSGGSTTPGSMLSAWRYAVKKAKELDMPLVIQMSYGVGSEQEGKAVAERLIDELLDENPGVVATVSAGNEGPGLSSVGLPSSAKNVIAVGAVLNRTSAKDLYGVSLSQDEIFSFSSRGGEMAKPQVVCPGFSASTVPVYEGGRNVFRGTSMASPQAAGACALLYSAALDQHLPLRRDICEASLERGAAPIAGYGPVDQGHGLVNVPRAWTVYQALASRKADHPVLYRAETESPEMADRKGPAAFWRGAFFPEGGRTQEIAVDPVFPVDASADFKANFFQAFDVSADASWLSVDKGSSYCKAGQPARIPIRFDAARLAKPGLYQAVVSGYAKESGSSERSKIGPDWTVPVTVVVPERFSPSGSFRIERNADGIKPAKVERIFFKIDPWIGSVNLDLRLAGGQRSVVAAYLFDPEGRENRFAALRPDRDRAKLSIDAQDVEPGVWELDLYASYANPGSASVKTYIQAFPLCEKVPADVPARLSLGRAPSAEITLVSASEDIIRGEGRGEVVGTATDKEVKLHAPEWSRPFSVAPGEAGVTFDISISPEDFNKFTDIPVQILDADGKAVESTGLSFRKGSISLDAAKPNGKYTLKIIGATADPDDDSPSWTLHVRELHRYVEPVPVAVKQGKESKIVLYPGHEQTLSLQLGAVPPALPDGAFWLAKITLKDAEREGLQLPMEIKLEGGK
jgi:tripeptidyl-peptidase-2